MPESPVCPRCDHKFSVWETSHANNLHPFICPNCGNALHPANLKSWVFGYLLGFIAAALPAKVYLYFDNNIILALIVGLICALTAIFAFAVYVNKTLRFE